VELYRIKSIKRGDGPEGTGGSWWKYEIECALQMGNDILGWRQGTKSEATQAVEKVVRSINSRTRGKTSRALRSVGTSPKNISVNRQRAGLNSGKISVNSLI